MRVIWSGTFVSPFGGKYIEINRVVDGDNIRQIIENCQKQVEIQTNLGLTFLFEKIVYVDKGVSDDRGNSGFCFLL